MARQGYDLLPQELQSTILQNVFACLSDIAEQPLLPGNKAMRTQASDARAERALALLRNLADALAEGRAFSFDVSAHMLRVIANWIESHVVVAGAPGAPRTYQYNPNELRRRVRYARDCIRARVLHVAKQWEFQLVFGPERCTQFAPQCQADLMDPYLDQEYSEDLEPSLFDFDLGGEPDPSVGVIAILWFTAATPLNRINYESYMGRKSRYRYGLLYMLSNGAIYQMDFLIVVHPDTYIPSMRDRVTTLMHRPEGPCHITSACYGRIDGSNYPHSVTSVSWSSREQPRTLHTVHIAMRSDELEPCPGKMFYLPGTLDALAAHRDYTCSLEAVLPPGDSIAYCESLLRTHTEDAAIVVHSHQGRLARVRAGQVTSLGACDDASFCDIHWASYSRQTDSLRRLFVRVHLAGDQPYWQYGDDLNSLMPQEHRYALTNGQWMLPVKSRPYSLQLGPVLTLEENRYRGDTGTTVDGYLLYRFALEQILYEYERREPPKVTPDLPGIWRTAQRQIPHQ